MFLNLEKRNARVAATYKIIIFDLNNIDRFLLILLNKNTRLITR